MPDEVEAAVGEAVFFGLQLGKRRGFDRGFPLEMDDHGELFGLLESMPQDLHKALDHPFEGVMVVVVHDQASEVANVLDLLFDQDVLFFELFGWGGVEHQRRSL